MTAFVPPAPAGLFVATSLLDTLALGVVELRPVYAPNDPAAIVDLTYGRVNSVAQRLLGLPEFPAGTFRTLGQHEPAVFAFFCVAFAAADMTHYAVRYPYPDQRDAGWRVSAQRQGEQLVVFFTNPLPDELLPLAAAEAEDLPGSGQLHPDLKRQRLAAETLRY